MKRSFTWGLVQLFLVYTALYLFFFEAPYLLDIPRKMRHLILMTSLLGVYGLGSYHLQFSKHAWMGSLWHLVHISGILILFFSGLFDWLIYPLNYPMRILLRQIHEFLISPVLYVGMGLLVKYLPENGKKSAQ
jgi:hypothetical protein